MKPVVLGLQVLCLWVMAACTGTIGGAAPGGDPADGDDDATLGEGKPGGSEPGVDLPTSPDAPGYRPPVFQCDAAAESRQQPLRRLTRLQYINTVNDLVTAMAGASAPAILAAIAPQLEKLPPDKYTSLRNKGRDGFTSADTDTTQLHADVTVAVAQAIGGALTDTAGKRQSLFGGCASDADTANDVACVDTFIRTWGPRVLRTPIEDADVAFYRQAMRGTTATPEALADVVALLMASPRVSLQIESQAIDEASPPHELASRLSYLLWDAPPDEALWAAAEGGALATEEGYRDEVQRLLDSPRATATLERFFTEWFSLYTTPDLTAGLRFADYAALVADHAPTPDARAGIVEDVLGVVRDIYAADRPMIDFLTEKRVYTAEPYVASIYGVEVGGEGPVPAPASRVGLITRPAFLATGDYSTHPILKGVRLRSALLCDRIPDPPADAMAQAEAIALPDGPVSQRLEAEVVTSPPGCAGCHALLNPLGFATENFDSLGRERPAEKIIDAFGETRAELPIDTRIVPNVDDLDTEPVDGAAGVMSSIVRSRKVEACFAAQYVRFAFGKVEEDDEADGCVLARLEEKARAGASLRALVADFVQSPQFTHRRVD